MTEIVVDTEPQLRIREIEPDDEPAVQVLFAASKDYFVALTGDRALPGDVQSLFYAAPEGVDPGIKEILVVTQGAQLVGLVDAVPGYPSPSAVSVGLFLIDPATGRRGVGTAVAQALLNVAHQRRFELVRATLPVGWEPGAAFLRSLGFEVDDDDQAGPGTANRVIHRGETGVIAAQLSLLP